MDYLVLDIKNSYKIQGKNQIEIDLHSLSGLPDCSIIISKSSVTGEIKVGDHVRATKLYRNLYTTLPESIELIWSRLKK